MKLTQTIFIILLFCSTKDLHAQKRIKIDHGKYMELADDSSARIFYKNGNLMSEGQLCSKGRTGLWKFYAEKTGVLYSIEHYNHGILEGEAEYFNNVSGVKYTNGPYKDGKRNGRWYVYSVLEGKQYGIWDIKNNLLDGHATYYDTFTNYKVAEGSHKEGKRIGKWRFYTHNTGKLHSVEYYENGLMEGHAKYYDSIRTCTDTLCGLEAEGSYLHNLRTGVWTIYNPQTGIIRSKQTYVDSIQNGPSSYYTTSGMLSIETIFKDGEDTRVGKMYDTLTGMLQSSVELDSESSAFICTYYFNDNRKTPSCKYLLLDDIEVGPKIIYDSITGLVKDIYYYEEGKLKGLSKYDSIG